MFRVSPVLAPRLIVRSQWLRSVAIPITFMEEPSSAIVSVASRQALVIRGMHTVRQSQVETANGLTRTPLSRLPMPHLLRNIVFGAMFKVPWASRLAIKWLEKLANNRQSALYPDNNPVVRWLLRYVLYDHFCAGTRLSEVQATIVKVKKLGYSGIILCPSREIMMDEKNETHASFTLKDNGASRQIEGWRDLYQETLSMVGRGDYVGIK